ncbi:MAG: MOSC domain-containing protein [Gemmatimonadetes bacterium]|nr:MOSC domain-containing protein [Gemmatimonadota bacterium]
MTRKHQIDSGSTGDPACHLDLEALEAGLTARAPTPRGAGTVTLLVRRGPGGAREVLQRAHLVRDGGLPGDRWEVKRRNRATSLTVMEDGVARLIANGQPLALFGDQIFVDLDLSRANLPAGSQVRMGSATLVVTPTPHDGCQKFRSRFGTAALRLVSGKVHRHLNLRGVYMRVVQDGDVGVGDVVTVLRRGEGAPQA